MKNWFLLPILLVATATQAQEAPTKAIKYDFFGPVAGCFGFSYETLFRPSTTWDIDAGFIGLRLGEYYQHDTFVGGYLSTGPRFYVKGDGEGPVDNYSDFKGLYLKPSIMLSYHQFTDVWTDYIYDQWGNYTYSDYAVDGSDFSASLLLVLGNQWAIREMMVLDLWFGLGYGGSWTNVNTEDLPEYHYYDSTNPYKYSFVRFGDSPLLFDGGLSLGILIK